MSWHTFHSGYWRDRCAYLEARDFANNLSDSDVIEIFSLVGVATATDVDGMREAIKYMKYNKLQRNLDPKIPEKDPEFESICDTYRSAK